MKKVSIIIAVALWGCGPMEADADGRVASAAQELKASKNTPKPVVAAACALNTTDAISATPAWSSSFSIYTTYNLDFAFDVPSTTTGHHQLSLSLFMPSGFNYQTFNVAFATDVAAGAGELQAQKLSTGYRVWVSLPVAGTIIQTSNLTGQWLGDAFLDTATSPSASATFFLN